MKKIPFLFLTASLLFNFLLLCIIVHLGSRSSSDICVNEFLSRQGIYVLEKLSRLFSFYYILSIAASTSFVFGGIKIFLHKDNEDKTKCHIFFIFGFVVLFFMFATFEIANFLLDNTSIGLGSSCLGVPTPTEYKIPEPLPELKDPSGFYQIDSAKLLDIRQTTITEQKQK